MHLHRHAVQDLDEAYRWSARSAPEAAARWLERVHATLATLAENPERCPTAPENENVHYEIRQLLLATGHANFGGPSPYGLWGGMGTRSDEEVVTGGE